MLDADEISLNLTSGVENTPKRKLYTEEPVPEKIKNEGHKPKKKRDNDTEEYISSLFNGNPDIPEMALGSNDVHLVKEDLFTEKDLESIGIHPYIISNLKSTGMSKLTLVQTKAIPVILAGKDALIKSQTGSGKTLAYALPILHKLQEIEPKISRSDGTFALIIVPTRELAVQSFEIFQKLCSSFARIVPGILLGGEKKKSEKARVRKGINILISTPGRLIDHIQHTERLILNKIRFLVFDEADRILELGYERDINTIVNSLNEKLANRQTLLLSATLTSGVEHLSKMALKHPDIIDVASLESKENGNFELELKTSLPKTLKQVYIIVPAKLRLVTLASFLLWKCNKNSKSKKILVFMSTQDMVDFHAELFDRCVNNSLDECESIKFLKLHGNMQQGDRLRVFKEFRSSNSGVLLCTDVAARGLDLPQVDWIVQYNPPTSSSDYVHRVGRTARIGAKGSSLIFVLPSESGFLTELENSNLAILAELTVDRILEKVFHYSELSDKAGKPPSTLEESATNLQMKMESAIVGDDSLHELASMSYISYVRSYASYPKEARNIFCFKSLHLGHIAKSFGLRDAPSKITGIGKNSQQSNWTDKQEKRVKNAMVKKEDRMIKSQRRRIDQRKLIMSEFDSGL